MIRRVRNLKLFKRVEKSRKLGMSYLELHKQFGISKGTLSLWFSKSKWSEDVKTRRSVRNKEQIRTHIALMNRIKSGKKLVRDDRYRQEALTTYEQNRSNPLFITGISLYWGEGDKANKNRISLINTDSDLLKIEINFFRKVLKVPESKLRAGIFIYDDIDKSKALDFWSNEIQLPKDQFIKTQILPSRSHLTKRKVLNGICSIYFSSVEFSIKMSEYIRLLANDLRL